MKILVTGCAGFIGSHTCEYLLKRGDQILGIDNLNDYYDVERKKENLAILKKYEHFKFRKEDISGENFCGYLILARVIWGKKANVLLKGTKVDGVYDKDPVLYSDAKKYNEISYSKVLKKNIRIMDLTAITLCKENTLPIHVFNINKSGDLKKVILGESIGTIINVWRD